jgi:hypothetical protein
LSAYQNRAAEVIREEAIHDPAGVEEAGLLVAYRGLRQKLIRGDLDVIIL